MASLRGMSLRCVCVCVVRECVLVGLLDLGGEEHDADRGAKGLGREVALKVGTDEARVAVGTGDPAPDVAHARALLVLLLALVHVCNTLPEVEVSRLARHASLKLEERCVGVLSDLGATQKTSVNGEKTQGKETDTSVCVV